MKSNKVLPIEVDWRFDMSFIFTLPYHHFPGQYVTPLLVTGAPVKNHCEAASLAASS